MPLCTITHSNTQQQHTAATYSSNTQQQQKHTPHRFLPQARQHFRPYSNIKHWHRHISTDISAQTDQHRHISTDKSAQAYRHRQINTDYQKHIVILLHPRTHTIIAHTINAPQDTHTPPAPSGTALPAMFQHQALAKTYQHKQISTDISAKIDQYRLLEAHSYINAPKDTHNSCQKRDSTLGRQ